MAQRLVNKVACGGLVAAAGLAVAVPPADAARLSQYMGSFQYRADAGEVNDATLRIDRVAENLPLSSCTPGLLNPCLPPQLWQLEVVDAGATITSFSCEAAASAGVCWSAYEWVAVDVRLEDGDDRAAVATGTSSKFGGSLHGGAGADQLVVEGPGWWVDGGSGPDRITGGEDDDFVMVRDGNRDTVDCGDGADRVDADALDVLESCESVTIGEPDTTAPVSSAQAPYGDTDSNPIHIPYTVSDPEPGSGIALVELWVRRPGETDFYLADATADTSYGMLTHDAILDGDYQAYTVAVDGVGNREAVPVSPDVTYNVNATAPTVTSTSPASGATGVATTATVRVAFSEPMDRAATQRAFALRDSAGRAVSGQFSWSGTTMTFTPKRLSRATRYDAQVSTAARDELGRAMEAAKTWSFVTS